MPRAEAAHQGSFFTTRAGNLQGEKEIHLHWRLVGKRSFTHIYNELLGFSCFKKKKISSPKVQILRVDSYLLTRKRTNKNWQTSGFISPHYLQVQTACILYASYFQMGFLSLFHLLEVESQWTLWGNHGTKQRL